MELDLAKETFNLARAVRSNVQAQKYFVQTQIEEGEAVLAILRKKAEQVAMKLHEADRQLGGARSGLSSLGIAFTEPPDARTTRHLAVQDAVLHAQAGDDEELEQTSRSLAAVFDAQEDGGESWLRITHRVGVQPALDVRREEGEELDSEESFGAYSESTTTATG